jgi:hypothetical protein
MTDISDENIVLEKLQSKFKSILLLSKKLTNDEIVILQHLDGVIRCCASKEQLERWNDYRYVVRSCLDKPNFPGSSIDQIKLTLKQSDLSELYEKANQIFSIINKPPPQSYEIEQVHYYVKVGTKSILHHTINGDRFKTIHAERTLRQNVFNLLLDCELVDDSVFQCCQTQADREYVVWSVADCIIGKVLQQNVR